MAKDPAVLFYTNDFLSGTFTMSNEQVGKYIRLLCLQHQKYELTEKDMLNICKTYDEDIYSKFTAKDGKYFNERMREESDRRKQYSESRKNNRNSIKDKEVSKSYVKHMETETINENEIVIKEEDMPSGFFEKAIPENLRSNEFIETWKNWVIIRYQKNDALLPRQVKEQLKYLSGFTVETAINLINTAITNGWKGIKYEGNNNGTNKNNRGRGSIDFDKYAAERKASKPNTGTELVPTTISK